MVSLSPHDTIPAMLLFVFGVFVIPGTFTGIFSAAGFVSVVTRTPCNACDFSARALFAFQISLLIISPIIHLTFLKRRSSIHSLLKAPSRFSISARADLIPCSLSHFDCANFSNTGSNVNCFVVSFVWYAS
jgi:hypothetical protein